MSVRTGSRIEVCALATTVAALLVACASGKSTTTSTASGTVSTRVDTRADEQAIRDLDRRWIGAVAAKDTGFVARLYADQGAFMPPNAPKALGTSAIRSAWAGLFGMPNLSLTFEPTEIQVSQSGDIAYDIGAYHFGVDSPAGRVQDEGKYVVVWRKIGGQWRVVADIFNSDRPAR